MSNETYLRMKRMCHFKYLYTEYIISLVSFNNRQNRNLTLLGENFQDPFCSLVFFCFFPVFLTFCSRQHTSLLYLF